MKKHFIFFASLALFCSFAGCSCDDDDDDDDMMMDAGMDTSTMDTSTGECTPDDNGPGAVSAPTGDISPEDACIMTVEAFIALDERCCTEPLTQIEQAEMILGEGNRCSDLRDIDDVEMLFTGCISGINTQSCSDNMLPEACLGRFVLGAADG